MQAHPDNEWKAIQSEAKDVMSREPILRPMLEHCAPCDGSLALLLSRRLATRLGRADLDARQLEDLFTSTLDATPAIVDAVRADLLAVQERDPACKGWLMPLLYFKGFQSITTHRIAHALWQAGRCEIALYLQSVSSEVFATDIHPAARIGRGILLDHATGFVVGETAEIGDNVSILHAVTLGGTGKEHGDRHPKVRSGVLIGAGAKILGNIVVGEGAKIGAGSVVLDPVPPHATVAGVPARIIGKTSEAAPALTMDQHLAVAHRRTGHKRSGQGG